MLVFLFTRKQYKQLLKILFNKSNTILLKKLFIKLYNKSNKFKFNLGLLIIAKKQDSNNNN